MQSNSSAEKLCSQLKARVSNTVVPIHIVALDGDMLIGVIALKEALIKSNKFWQRQVSKFEALVLSIVILWFKTNNEEIGNLAKPHGASLQGINSVVENFPKGATILKIYA